MLETRRDIPHDEDVVNTFPEPASLHVYIPAWLKPLSLHPPLAPARPTVLSDDVTISNCMRRAGVLGYSGDAL